MARPSNSSSAPARPKRKGPRPGGAPSRSTPSAGIAETGPGQRRALSHVGGQVTFQGTEPELQSVLAEALRVNSDEEVIRAHVHGFHSYPARLHPATARGLIEGLSTPGKLILDPFCGSGTVLVEAALAGRRAVGVDANPLSVLLCQVKCTRSTPAMRATIAKQADLAMEEALERRRLRAPPHRKYPEYDRTWFDAHVLLELDSLHHRLQQVSDDRVRSALLLVFSSLITKVSRKAGDSAARQVHKRIASGYTIRHFGDRTRELLSQLEEYAELVGPKPPEVRVLEGDARKLTGVVPASVDLIVSSPPYPGVFDYLDHHELRLRWLGLGVNEFSRSEIGSRRQMDNLGDEAVVQWRKDMSRVLAALSRVLRPEALACLVLADSVVSGRALLADRMVPELAPKCGFRVVAIASQRRPYFHRATAAAFAKQPRQEHVLVLRKGS